MDELFLRFVHESSFANWHSFKAIIVQFYYIPKYLSGALFPVFSCVESNRRFCSHIQPLSGHKERKVIITFRYLKLFKII